MLDEHNTTITSVWLVVLPMLISVYIASLLITAVFVNVIDGFIFEHIVSNLRNIFVYGSIFVGFFVASFCISISTYIAIPVYKKIFMVVVFFIPIIWPKIILLFLFAIENTDYKITGVDIELVLFIIGSVLGGFSAYLTVSKFEFNDNIN